MILKVTFPSQKEARLRLGICHDTVLSGKFHCDTGWRISSQPVFVYILFGNPGEQINLVPMNKGINASGGSWYNMEQGWAARMQNGVNITDVKIDIQYGTSGRPTRLAVTWKENGVEIPQPVVHNN
jgi:hypothetical protein